MRPREVPESSCPGEAQVWNRVTRYQKCPGEPASPGLGDGQIGSESPVPGEAKKESTAIRYRWGTKSTGLGEAQMGIRFTRSR